VGTGEERNPGACDERLEHFRRLVRRDLAAGLGARLRVVVTGRPGDCACVQTDAAEGRSRTRPRRMREMDLTSMDVARDGAVDVELSVSRYLKKMGDGVRQDAAFDRGVAAGRDGTGGGHSAVEGEHVEDVRRLKSECVLLLDCLAHSRGSCLDGDSPALRICMETTRASLLWQAAAVRPEPERMPSLRVCEPT
jgi:hypothetical protein